jgi:hypothetical protein
LTGQPLIRYDIPHAGVAELVDALDSKSSMGSHVWVQVPPPVLQGKQQLSFFLFFFV